MYVPDVGSVTRPELVGQPREPGESIRPGQPELDRGALGGDQVELDLGVGRGREGPLIRGVGRLDLAVTKPD